MMNNKAPPREYFESKVSVWWDMDKCPIPDGYDAWRVGPCIKSELEKLGYSGPLTIFGLGNLKHIPEHVLQALFSTGIVLEHVPTEISNTSILTSILFGEDEHQAPVTIMVITDSVRFDFFYSSVSRLQRDYKCNILLAYQDSLEEDYSLVTHEQWFWKTLLKDAKCSETGDFSCNICSFACQSFEEVTKHLKGEAHALKEPGVRMPRDPVDEKMMVEAGVDSSHPQRKKQPKRKAKKMKMSYEHLPQDHE